MAGSACSRRGVRGANAKLAGVLQPFLPLLVSWAGRGESPRLTGAELDTAGMRAAMPQARLMSGWYLSELVMSLTVRHDPQPELYDHYRAAIDDLRTASNLGAHAAPCSRNGCWMCWDTASRICTRQASTMRSSSRA